jgi:putative N6-adenine-specific DNA methylase
MYEYQKNNRYFAQIADGIKELGIAELTELGAGNVSSAYRGIYFDADAETLYRINYSSRLVSRVLAPLVWFRCHTTDQLHKKAMQIKWTDFISPKNTFAIFSNVSNSKIRNSKYAALRLKDGIVDSFRDSSGERPNIDTRDPDIWLNLHIENNEAIISLDTSGGSLHRRGYRKDAIEAPMQETVAAAIIRYSEWDGSVPLYDPMCGSGTLLAEALMYYCLMPSSLLRRHFGFEYLPDFNRAVWTKVKKELSARIRKLPDGLISGSDSSAKAVNIATENLGALKYGNNVKLKTVDFNRAKGFENGIIVTNPPYGIRMGKKEKLDTFYKSFGDFLKQKCKGSTAYIYFGEREFIKMIGLKPTWKKPLKTGGLDGRLAKYEMF